MFRHAHRTFVAAVATTAAVLSVAPAATAATAASSRITVRASDYEVDPGEQFLLRGRLTSDGAAVPGATVRVQTWRNDGWVRIPGAVVSTDRDGRYRVRIVLSSGGDRDLRVVGNPVGDDIRTARTATVVRVLG